MKNTIKWVLSFLIFFAAVPTVQASDMNNSAEMSEVKKKKGFFSKFKGAK